MSTIPASETQRTDSQSPSGVGESHQAMQTARRLTWLMFALCLIVTGTAAVYESAGFAPAALIGAAGLLSMLGWQAAETKRRPVPVSFIVPYSLVVMSLLVQNAEEFAFRSMDSSVFSSVPGFALYSIGAASLFMLGGAALAARHPLGAWSAWLVCIWAAVQSLAHYAYPLFSDSRYFYIPGQAAAWIPLLVGLYGLIRLIRGPRRSSTLIHEGGKSDVR